jgi:hypothetical protein
MSRISLLQDALRSLDYGIAIEPSSVWHEEVRAEVEKEPAKLTDEEINDCFDIAQRSFHKHQSGIKGQQLNIQDWPNWHFARAIEQKIWGRAE